MSADSVITLESEIECRICHCEAGKEKIISPCYCLGSLKYVHLSCLQAWINTAGRDNRDICELCNYEFQLQTTTRPLLQWKLPALTLYEQRRVTCLLIMIVLAGLCMIWSIHDIVETIKIRSFPYPWVFWTKLMFIIFCIVIIGWQYYTFSFFFKRLREHNRVLMVLEKGVVVEEQLLQGSAASAQDPLQGASA